MPVDDMGLDEGFDPVEEAYLDMLSPTKPRDRKELRRAYAVILAKVVTPDHARFFSTVVDIERYLREGTVAVTPKVVARADERSRA